MAGPSIAVRVLGDLKGLGQSFKDAGKVAEGAGSKIHSAFSGVLGLLNRTGVLGPFGEALSSIDDTLGDMAEHGKTVGNIMMGLGGTVAGIGLGLSALGSKEKESHNQLAAAIEATGKSYEDYGGQIEKAIKHNEHFGQSSKATQDALRVLTQATGDPQKALDLLSTATDLAAAKHEDLASAAGQLGKVYNGNAKLLKEFGIVQTKTKDGTKDNAKAVDELSAKLHGQAAASVDSFTGKLKVLGTEVEDQAAAFGQKYGPAITAAGSALTVMGAVVKSVTALQEAHAAAQEAATTATEATTVAEEGATAAGIGMMATMGLIVLAVLALVAVGYVIYRNWSTIWAAIHAAIMAVYNWIKVNWPLLLTILLGPIGLAVAIIVKYWDQIKAGAAAAIAWVRTNWPVLLAIITGPIGLAVLAIQRNWNAIKQGASDAVQWVKDGWNGLVSFFAGIPHRITSVVSGMFDGIWNAFKSVIDRVINGWNSLRFTMPSIDTHIPGVGKIGGWSVGTPYIRPLATGGLITREGLFYLHAGEAVTPAARTGPAVHIENANFAQELDIDTFMRRAAWVVRTARV